MIDGKKQTIVWELWSIEFKLTFIPASALLAMHSIYIEQLLRPAAAPLIVCMHVCLGGVAMVCDYPHPAIVSCFWGLWGVIRIRVQPFSQKLIITMIATAIEWIRSWGVKSLR